MLNSIPLTFRGALCRWYMITIDLLNYDIMRIAWRWDQ